MLLGKKTRYTVGADWAVILDRSTNEFAKNRATDKLSQAFNLSLDEAKDLAENTPIILLDKLPLDIAEKVKDYFAQSNVDCSLTNDTFTKRKCFRAVWPSQPDLASLIGNAAEINETGTYMPTSKGIEEELNDLTRDLQKENQSLQSQLQKVESNSVDLTEVKEVDSNKEALKSDHVHFEEAMNRLRNENQILVNKITELELNLKSLKQSSEKDVRSQFTELRAQLDHYRNEYTRTQNAGKQAQSESRQFQTELIQTQKTLSQTRAEIGELKQEAERVKTELDEWKRKANDWSANYFKVIKENEFLRANQSEELESVKVRNQQLTTQLENAQRQIREFVVQLDQQDLIQKRMKAASEMAEQESQLKLLVHKQRALEDEIRAREEEMKKVLLEQETVERAILNAKQAQKYLMEQSKLKEKSRSTRPKIVNPTLSQEPGSSLESELND